MRSDILHEKWPRRLGFTILCLLLLGAAALIILRVVMLSGWGHAYVLSKIEASQPLGQSIEVEAIEGDLLKDWTVKSITVSDERGIWVTASDVRVAWSPLKILMGTLKVNTVSVSDVHLIRRPELEISQTDRDSNLRHIKIGDMLFPSVRISEALLSQEQILSLKGSASHGPAGGALILKARTIGDASRDTVDADIQWSPEFILSGNAKVESLPGGVIASALRLSADKSLTFDMRSSGTQQDLKTEILGHLGSVKFIQTQIRRVENLQKISGVLNPERVRALSAIAPIFGGAVKFEGDVDHAGDNLNFAAKLTSPHLDMDGVGRQTGNGIKFSVFDMTSRSPMVLFSDMPATVKSVSFSGDAVLGGTQSATGQLTIRKMVYDLYELDVLSGPVTLNRDNDTLAFNVNMTGQAGPKNVLNRWTGKSPRFNVVGSYNTRETTLLLSKANIRVPGLVVTGQGRTNISRQTANFDGSYALEKNGLGLEIPANLNGRFSLRPRKDSIDLTLSGKASDISNLPVLFDDLIGTSADYSSKINRTTSGRIDVTQAKLSARGLSVDGMGTYGSDGNIQARLNFDAESFQVNQVEIPQTTGQVNLSGVLKSLSFDVSGQAPSIMVSHRALSDVTYNLEGMRTDTHIDTIINLMAVDTLGPVALETKALVANQNWSLKELNSTLFGLSVSGDVSGTGGDLASIESALKVTGNPSQFIPANELDLSLSLANEAARISVHIKKLSVGALVDGALRIEAQGPRNAVTFKAVLTGMSKVNDITRPIDLTLSGLSDLKDPELSIMSELDGTIGQYVIGTIDPLYLKQSERGLAGQGTLSLLEGSFSYVLSDAAPTLILSGKDLTLASILALAGRPGIDGLADFEAIITRKQAGLDGEFNAVLSNLKQPGSQAGTIDLNIAAQLMDDQFSMTASTQNEVLRGESHLKGVVQTSSVAPFIKWPPANALSGDVRVLGNIGTITELFLPPETDLEGRLAADMRYSIPLESRGLTGTLSISDGVFEQGAIGAHLTDISFNSEFDGAAINVPDFSAKGKKGGTLMGGGRMVLAEGESGAITLMANKLYLFNRREGDATVSGNLNFSKTNEKLKLAGKLNVDEARVSVDKFPRAGRPTLDVNFSSDDDEKPETIRYATELDVAVTSAGRIALRGRGINAALALSAKFTGPFGAPILSGEASIVRGRFDFLGKRFELKDSRVTFADKVMDSRLEMKAVRATNDLTATVEVSGTLDRPVIDLRSDPTLPEDEVLSYILFGRSASQLTTIETARLAAALAQLSGGGGFDLLGGLENALGLDTLDFAQTEAGQTQLTTGKYLSKDVYVEVRSSVEGSPGLAVEWTPRKNVAIEAETSPGDTQRISIQWQKDFD